MFFTANILHCTVQGCEYIVLPVTKLLLSSYHLVDSTQPYHKLFGALFVIHNLVATMTTLVLCME